MEWLALGLNVASAFGSYQADKAASKAQRAWQAYSNTMARLSDGINQNAITTNEILSGQAFAEQGVGIKQQNILTQAQAEVSAAAAGVKGTSVDDVMFDIRRNAAVAENQRQNDFAASNLAFDQQRLSSSMSAAMQQDYTYIPKPKLGSYLLQAAAASVGGFQKSSSGPSMGAPTSAGAGNGQAQVELPWLKPKSTFDKASDWLSNSFQSLVFWK